MTFIKNMNVNMLCPTHTFDAPPFIRRAESGSVRHLPALTYCLVEYDRAHYSDALFQRFSQPFPTALTGAVAKRRAEYLASRYCGQVLLGQANATSAIIGTHERVPQWPTGWRGSISHSDKYALVVIAPEAAGLMPGIDIEQWQPEIMLETADMFASSDEQTLLSNLAIPYPQALLTLFSAKESLYKSQWPEVRRYFDFQAAKVTCFDEAEQRFTLTLTETLTPELTYGTAFSGSYMFLSDAVITCIG